MSFFRRRPRAFRPSKLFEECNKLLEQVLAVESERLRKVESLKTDSLEFFRQVLNVEPTHYQKELSELYAAKTSLVVIAEKLGKSLEFVRSKIRRLCLEEDDRIKNVCSSSSLAKFLPDELPSIEAIYVTNSMWSGLRCVLMVGWRLVIRRVPMMTFSGLLHWLFMQPVRCRRSRFWRWCLGDATWQLLVGWLS